MTPEEQREFVLNYIERWASSKDLALKWYESEIILSLNKTAKQAVDGGEFEAVKQYLKHIKNGGFT